MDFLRSALDSRPRSASKSANGLFEDLQNHTAHAFAKVFQTVPAHNLDRCRYCYEHARHKPSTFEPTLPMHMQKHILGSTQIRRQAFIQAVPGTAGQPKRIGRMARALNFHLTVEQPATFEQVQANLATLSCTLPVNSHCMLWLDGLTRAHAEEIIGSLGDTINRTHFWVVTVGPFETKACPETVVTVNLQSVDQRDTFLNWGKSRRWRFTLDQLARMMPSIRVRRGSRVRSPSSIYFGFG